RRPALDFRFTRILCAIGIDHEPTGGYPDMPPVRSRTGVPTPQHYPLVAGTSNTISEISQSQGLKSGWKRNSFTLSQSQTNMVVCGCASRVHVPRAQLARSPVGEYL